MNNKKINELCFLQLNHRLIRMKANAFMKLVLYTEALSSDSQEEKKSNQTQVNTLVKSIENTQESIQKIALIHALQRIKLAGWKLIPEAHAQEEQDSLAISKDNDQKMAQSDATMLPASIILRDITNIHQNSPLNKSPISPIMRSKLTWKQNYCQQPTLDTSRNVQKQLKMRKRNLILKKLENVEMCIDYMAFNSQIMNQNIKRNGYIKNSRSQTAIGFKQKSMVSIFR